MKKLLYITLASILMPLSTSYAKWACCIEINGDFEGTTDCVTFESKEKCEATCQTMCSHVADNKSKESAEIVD